MATVCYCVGSWLLCGINVSLHVYTLYGDSVATCVYVYPHIATVVCQSIASYGVSECGSVTVSVAKYITVHVVRGQCQYVTM